MQNRIITKNSQISANYNGIDLVKFILAFLIITIHIPVLTTDFGVERAFNFAAKQFSRIAVPYYFAASGFLMFRKTEFRNPDMSRVKNYCFRILRLFGMWTLLLVTGGRNQLWYLGSVAVSVLIVSLLLKSNLKIRTIVVLALILYIIGIAGDGYYGFFRPIKCVPGISSIIAIYSNWFSTTRNGLFFGFPFVFMGALFAHKIIKMNLFTAIIGFIVFSLAGVFESVILKLYSTPKTLDLIVSIVPSTFFLLYISLNLRLKNSAVFKKMRNAGMLIYCTHLLLYDLTINLVGLISRILHINLMPLSFIICAILVTIVSFFIVWLSDNRFKWLRYLYS